VRDPLHVKYQHRLNTVIADDNDDNINKSLTNLMEQSTSWESESSSNGQQIPRLLWNSNVHYGVHNSSPI